MGSKTLEGGITPLHIEVALHYLKSQAPGGAVNRRHAGDAVTQICHEFADAGLLEIADDNKTWKATDALRQYVEALCKVPLPEEHPDLISHLDTILKEGKDIGDDTITTRNVKIAAVRDEYVAATPKAKI